MIDDAIARIPLKYRLDVIWALLAIAALGGAGFGLGVATGTHTVIVHKARIVKETWGRPDSSISAAQVSPAFAQAGLTVCDIYQAKRTVVCH